ncbi:aldehyde dehydrogenase [Argonema antarcticum]|uniref:aldehyde dehydrogenase n=1 Tax=Argonema antarcticum TaxID=2942763 RepID=UPI002013BBC9|nr:aldehyde dehydrogenase [Argonema antarcticum]MCL1475328.1 aldehyde dehydrogenase [Argonema antarcticum A004/B2]
MLYMLLRFIENQYQQILNFLSEQHHRRSEERRKMFLARIQPQPELDFIANCFHTACERQRKVAIAVRNAIAKLGCVESIFIRSEACFEDFDLLPFWECCGDAGFDSVLFIEAIQEELGVKFTNEQLSSLSVSDPDLNTQMKISEFVRDFYRWYSNLL